MVNYLKQIKSTILKSKTNNILILGKGPSLDKFVSYDFKNFFVININDTFKIYNGKLILINKPWAYNEINRIKEKVVILSDHEYSKRINKNIKQYIFTDKLKNVHNIKKFANLKIKNQLNPLFLIAIEILYSLGLVNNRKFNVYFLGFDFTFKHIDNYTSNYLLDFDQNRIDQKKNILNSQKSLFYSILKNSYLKKYMNLRHIGNLSKSYSNVNNFIKLNKLQKESIKINKIKIVAEITTNHFGDIKTLKKMTKLAKDAGADFVKIQKRNVETFYSKKELNKYYYSKFGNTFRDYRNGLELSLTDLKVFNDYCKKIGIKWFSSILDEESFDIIKNFKPAIIKLPSTISNFKSFHTFIAKNFKGELVISTGFTNSNYENYIFNKFKKNKKIYLLQCTSSYPTLDKDCNIAVISHYKNLSIKNKKIFPGFSSHDIGATASLMAVAAGAMMIEKHVKLYSEPWAHFDKVALNLRNNEFKNFVTQVRKAEEIYGIAKKTILKSEFHKYKNKI